MSPTPQQFVSAVREPLQAGDADALVREVERRWVPQEVAALLYCGDATARGAAAVVLGLIGGKAQAGVLSRLLHDDDASVRQMAEHALWSIWLRCGSPDAIDPLQEGLRSMAEERYEAAIEHLEDALHRDPEFAEAYHQLGIAQMVCEQWDDAAEAFRATTARLPSHFAAWSGLGHCCCHQRKWRDALDAYRKALAIHPRLPEIPEAVERVRARVVETPQPMSMVSDRY